MKIGVIGASGYSGGELLRLLSKHPIFQLEYIAAGAQSGTRISSVHPFLYQVFDSAFEATSIERANDCNLIFIALPHGQSAPFVSGLSSSVRIVDLGADFRLTSSEKWRGYYGGEHAGKWVYGMPELPGNYPQIAASNKVANPGCFATCILAAIAPSVARNIVDSSDVVAVAASGTTGAGRTPSVRLMASEVMGSLTSYKFGGTHQHTPEIEEALDLLTEQEVKVSFTPILAPMPRGILATVTARLNGAHKIEDIRETYENFYSESPFVKLLPEGQIPQTSDVINTNNVYIQIAIDSHTQRLVVSSALDNLGKGAASQAIQNANIMCGLAPETGLL